jgi:hypothetical protein
MRSKGHVVFSVFLLVVGGYVVYSASRWTFKTGFFPMAIAVPLIILALTHLLMEFFGPPEKTGGPAVEAEFSNETPPDVARRREFAVFSWIAGFIALVFLVGFPVAVPFFILFFLKLQSGVGWWQSVGLTAVAWGFFHVLFERIVRLQFEAGLFQTWLGL